MRTVLAQLGLLGLLGGVVLLVTIGPLFAASLARRGMGLFGFLGGWAVRKGAKGTWWLVRRPHTLAWRTAKTGVALAGEEVQRWLGLLMGGVILMALTWTSTKIFTWAPIVILIIGLVDLLWFAACISAVRRTADASLAKTRNRKMAAQVDETIGQIPGQLRELRDTVGKGGTTVRTSFRHEEQPLQQPKEAQQAQTRIQKEYEAALADQAPPGVNFEPVFQVPGRRAIRKAAQTVRKGWKKG